MPLLHLHLVELGPQASVESVVQGLRSSECKVILASTPHHWVIKPSKHDVDGLLDKQWDLMVLLEHPSGDKIELPSPVRSHITSTYTVPVGVPSKLLAGYPEKNVQLLKQAPNVPLTGSLDKALDPEPADSQNLELSSDLRNFMHSFTKTKGLGQPVTMLNLLCFKHGRGGKEEYAKYGQQFRQTGGRRGGDAKIVGNVVRRGRVTEPEAWWNEVAIVHYPSIRHFCDMAAGDDYQEGNHKYRLPALYDTILLCTTEIPLDRASKL